MPGKKFDDFFQRRAHGVVVRAPADLQIGEQVQPVSHVLGRLPRHSDQLIQFARRQVKPVVMGGVDDGEFLPGLGCRGGCCSRCFT